VNYSKFFGYVRERVTQALGTFPIASEERDAKHGVTSVPEQPSSPERSRCGVTRWGRHHPPGTPWEEQRGDGWRV